jgi:hypothetical protein
MCENWNAQQIPYNRQGPGGPTAKRQPSPEGLGYESSDLSAGGAAPVSSHHMVMIIGRA